MKNDSTYKPDAPPCDSGTVLDGDAVRVDVKSSGNEGATDVAQARHKGGKQAVSDDLGRRFFAVNSPRCRASATSVAPPLTKREIVHFLISSRRLCRSICRSIDDLADANQADRRVAAKHRQSGGPLLIRNAEVIESRIATRRSEIKAFNETLSAFGRLVRSVADEADQLIPRNELLDILEVNPADRAKLKPGDGLRQIVFVHGLEDSATNRNSAFRQGPLFEAMSRYMISVMKSDPELSRTMTAGLFGKGGMFEFLPTYRRNEKGEFVRNPPKLRVADECDIAGGAK